VIARPHMHSFGEEKRWQKTGGILCNDRKCENVKGASPMSNPWVGLDLCQGIVCPRTRGVDKAEKGKKEWIA
jgi:hypothetical protein